MPPRSTQSTPVSEPAPWYKIANQQFISIEHPCVVKNVTKGIDMLGGSKGIRDALSPIHSERPVRLSLHPEDPTNRPLISFNRPTNNVLLKITVPKRTGRKRKRGSDEPFEDDPEHPDPSRKDARYMLRSLKDNQDNFEIEALGTIEKTHLFRTMPDFTYAVSSHPIVSEITSKILPLQYSMVKDFKLDLSTRHNTTYPVLPPPVFSTHSLPQNYSYRQNPAIKRTVDPTTNVTSMINPSNPARVFTHQLQYDTSFIPSCPDPSAPPLDTQNPNLIGLVTLLGRIFAQRPIWTRRALMNQLPSNAPQFLLRYAVSYVAYAMRSGPWRDTYIRFGVDPRSSPDYRIYQTLLLQLVASRRVKKTQRSEYLRSWKPSTDKTSHIFKNSSPFPADGKAWQLCDLTNDPVLRSLVETSQIRPTCELRYFGWYHNGTSAKLRIVLKSKADMLMTGKIPDDTLYTVHFLKLPDEYRYNPASADQNFARRTRASEQQRASEPQRATDPPEPSDLASQPTITDDDAAANDEEGRPDDPPPSSSTRPDADIYRLGILPRSASRAEMEFAATYRGMCRSGPGWEGAKTKAKTQDFKGKRTSGSAVESSEDVEVPDQDQGLEEGEEEEEELDIDMDDAGDEEDNAGGQGRIGGGEEEDEDEDPEEENDDDDDDADDSVVDDGGVRDVPDQDEDMYDE